jgi:hypothetical protein
VNPPLSKTAPVGYATLLALSSAAFWPKYLSRLTADIDPYTHLHAAIALLWCLLLIVQPILARRHRPAHRRLGAVSYVLAPSFVVASLLLAHQRFRAMSDATFATEAPSLFLPLSAVLLFSLSYLLAIRYRRNVALHARFMILTGLPMIDPVLGRVLFFFFAPLPNPLLYQAVTFGLTDLVVAVLLFRPFLVPRLRATYAAAGASFPLLHLAWFTVAQSSAWLPFAAWFRSLPLP